jgi:hypothetical protein
MVTVGGGFGNDEGRTCTSGLPNCRQWTAYEQHKQVEVWDPRTGAWTLGPSQLEHRAYHSTALLLPDASVVSAGDDINGGNDRDTFEIYRPAYFHRGDFLRERPTITNAPGVAGYGRRIGVDAPDPDVVRATLVAPGATTHAVDMNQRLVELPVTRRPDGGGYTVETPASADVAPPGFYMLFLVDAAGRPSRAAWVRLDPTAPAPAPPPAPPVTRAEPDLAGPAPDRTAPGVRVRFATKRLREVRARRRVDVGVRLNEPGLARVHVVVTSTRAGRRARTVRRWQRSSVRFTRARWIALRAPVTRSQRRRLRGAVRLAVSVTAQDAAGNRRVRTAGRRLR